MKKRNVSYKRFFSKWLGGGCALLLWCCMSCGKGREEAQQEMARFRSQPVVLPFEQMEHLSADSLSAPGRGADGEAWQLIVYYDSTDCSSCAVSKLYFWEDILANLKKYRQEVRLRFLFAPVRSETEGLRGTYRLSVFKPDMYIDTLGVFEKMNPCLPENKAMHTFLLDENRNVILVGNPLENPKIEEMFYKLLEESE